MSNFSSRLRKIRAALRSESAVAALITNFTNVTYLTGFTGDDSYLLVTRTNEILLSDPRYTTQLAEECPGLELIIRKPGVSMLDALEKVIRKAKVGTLLVEGGSMTLGVHQQLCSKLTKTKIHTSEGLVEKLRLIKDKSEIDQIRLAVALAEKAFGVIRASLRPDQTEKRVANEIEYQIRLFGGVGCSFPPIVAVGPRSALPHATPTDQTISASDFVLVDWGAQGNLYVSDLTRVLVTGKISPKLERIYGVVLEAQRQAIAAIKPGVTMESVDSVARTIIDKFGYGKLFGHGLGHGIGLNVHEAPRLAVNQKEPLQAGMVVTVEPGIYVPGWGGVRIEDDVVVTKSGHEVLTNVAKELDACVAS